jgi:hypothetical protein
MGINQEQQGSRDAPTDPTGIRDGRQRDRRTVQGVAFGLAVQGLMLTELLKHDHGQQV